MRLRSRRAGSGSGSGVREAENERDTVVLIEDVLDVAEAMKLLGVIVQRVELPSGDSMPKSLRMKSPVMKYVLGPLEPP